MYRDMRELEDPTLPALSTVSIANCASAVVLTGYFARGTALALGAGRRGRV